MASRAPWTIPSTPARFRRVVRVAELSFPLWQRYRPAQYSRLQKWKNGWKVINSVTRLGHFRKFFSTIFLTEQPKYLVTFWGSVKNIFLSKVLFGLLFGKYWINLGYLLFRQMVTLVINHLRSHHKPMRAYIRTFRTSIKEPHTPNLNELPKTRKTKLNVRNKCKA